MVKVLILYFISVSIIHSIFSFDHTKWKNKNSFFFFQGTNATHYTRSNVHFEGNGFDFTIKNAIGVDRPDILGGFKVLGGNTREPYNFYLGYFITDVLAIMIGLEHMKYFLVDNSTVSVEGKIEPSISVEHAGNYNGEKKSIVRNFVYLDHTDGLNNVPIDVLYFKTLLKKFDFLSIDVFAGGGIGIMPNVTNSSVFGIRKDNELYVSGYSISTLLGLRIVFVKIFSIGLMMRFSYIDLVNIPIHESLNGKASQRFFSTQRVLFIGFQAYF